MKLAPLPLNSGAILSEDGKYRYALWRNWGGGGQVCWVLLNPSTADATRDDPTIRRCRGFSERWGYGGMVVVNLFALRATDPKQLARHPMPSGPENAQYVDEEMRQAALVVCAWGADPMARGYLFSGRPLFCLGKNKDGSPKHPLYIRGDAELVAWP